MSGTHKNIGIFFIALLWLGNTAFAVSGKTIHFSSADGLVLTADLYVTHPPQTPFILLFHQAGWSRGEYLETAPKLNALGFNCLALDQRSGGEVNGIVNQSHAAALKAGKGTTYLDAIQDMQAAIGYVKTNFPKARIILWGSSYSAALVLRLAGTIKPEPAAVLSFSPGEYFKKLGQSGHFVRDGAQHIQCPVFIASARSEVPAWDAIWKSIPSGQKVRFIPKTAGHHGSRALWKKFTDSKALWKAVKAFLTTLLQ